MSNNDAPEILKFLFHKKSEKLQLLAINFENGLFLALSELANFRIGTVALSLPFNTNVDILKDKNQMPFEQRGRGISAVTVFGARNEIYAKALAEKVTYATGKLIYLSINFTENDSELYSEALTLINEFIKENYG